MRKLHQLAGYLCLNYQESEELSFMRLSALIYLADWFCALNHKRTITDVAWEFNHKGPTSLDLSCLLRSNHFDVKHAGNLEQLRFAGTADDFEFDEQELTAVEYVIQLTKVLFFSELLDYVYSTYPVVAPNRSAQLDLPVIAEQFRVKHYSQKTR